MAEVSVLSCYRVAHQAQWLREQLTSLRSLLGTKAGSSLAETPLLEGMAKDLFRLAGDLKNLLDTLRRAGSPLEQKHGLVPTVQMVLDDTMALIDLLDELRTNARTTSR